MPASHGTVCEAVDVDGKSLADYLARATVSAHTDRAPPALRAMEQASSVAPVVQTSSTKSTRLPCSRFPVHENAPATFSRRSGIPSPTCDVVYRTRRNTSHTTQTLTAAPRCCASNCAWLYPRSRTRRLWSGTGTRTSTGSGSFAQKSTSRLPSGSASARTFLYLKLWIASRNVPSKKHAERTPSITSARSTQ
jgi:hypothetical protein